MTLKPTDCFEIIEFTLGGKSGSPIEPMEMVNHAGQLLVSMHPWNWLTGRSVTLTLRAKITIAGATWTETGPPALTLTSTGSFTNYSFLAGDTIKVTGGTGATVGTYIVASRTDNDNIVLTTSIGAAADGSTDIAATLNNDQVELPADFDFQRIIAYQANNALVSTMSLTTYKTMLDLRSVTPGVSTLNFWAIVNHVRDPSGGPPIKRMEVYPSSDTTEEKFIIFYRGGWLKATNDSVPLDIPEWLEPLYIEMLKEVARGHEMEDELPLYMRVERIAQSGMFMSATLRDGQSQIDLGPITGGMAEPDLRASIFANESLVGDP